jgi:subfamily B ATP-binding cassette protein MsbA
VPSSDKAVTRFLLQLLKKQKGLLLLSALGALLMSLVDVGTMELAKNFLDRALIQKDMSKVYLLCAGLVGFFLADGFFTFLHRFSLRVATERVTRELRDRIFGRFLVFSQAQSSLYTSGAAVNHIINDVSVVSTGLHVLADLIRSPLMIATMLGYMIYQSWQLSLVCLITLPLVAWVGKGLGRSARRNQGRIQRTLDDTSSHVLESVKGLRTAQSLGHTKGLRQEFHAQLDSAYGWYLRLAKVQEAVGPLTKWVTSWAGAFLIGFGAWLVINGEMSTGALFAYLFAAGSLQQPLRQLNDVNVRLQQVMAAAERVHALLVLKLDPVGESQRDALESATAAPVRPSAPAPLLRIENVSFRYPARPGEAADAAEAALNDVTLELAPGRKVALVGRSGSGKSTLALLAMRFLDPTQGRVTLGGRPAPEWDLGDYRAHFAHVSQEVFLFHRTLRENLLLARPGATDSQLWDALEKAHIAELARRLPLQLDTPVGEQAASFSGGERQRLAIARAFLRDSPILVLDEATSQLDAHAETHVQAALQKLMQDRSVLIIAHRLATVREADEILVMDGGRVLERGSPAELLRASDGAFTRLWQAQAGHSS